jgi:UDP-4-amino-4,6-dideoxy-N-acetyl-beta-L-altrosamine transaminase
MSALLPYGRQTIEEDDVVAVAEALRGEFLTTGPMVERFERSLAERCGARHAVAVSSGTAALQAAYFAAGLGPGTELVTTPLTFAATASAALLLGARPVFADIDSQTLTLDPIEVRRKLSPRTRVIAPVDYAGEPADIDALRALARERDILVVEDASHALGARLDGRPVGSLADLTVFSFHPVKHITTGEGGAVLTDSDILARRARDFRNHGIVRDRERLRIDEGDWFYDILEIGQNFRLTDVQCALGVAQLKKLDQFLARRRAIARAYFEAFRDSRRLMLPPARNLDSHAWHIFPIRLVGPNPERRRVFEGLRSSGIGVQVHYVPVTAFAAYRALGYRPEETPRAYDAYQRLISLPLFPGMTDGDIETVISALHTALA